MWLSPRIHSPPPGRWRVLWLSCCKGWSSEDEEYKDIIPNEEEEKQASGQVFGHFLGWWEKWRVPEDRVPLGIPPKSPKTGIQPVISARERGHAGGARGKSLTGGAGHDYRAEQNHRPKCAACPRLTWARARCFPYLYPMNIPLVINRTPNKSPPGSAVATSNYSLTCYLQPIWEQKPTPVLGKRLQWKPGNKHMLHRCSSKFNMALNQNHQPFSILHRSFLLPSLT